MPDAYGIQEARFIQVLFATSAAGALVQAIGPVPAGKIWTVLQAFATNSVGAGGETKYYWFAVSGDGSIYYPVTRPVSQVVDSTVAQYFPMLQEGLELKLWPHDYLAVRRDSATAGSTLSIYARIIETDMPLYTYDEPQIVKRMTQARSSVLQRMGGGIGRGSGAAGPVMPGGSRKSGGGSSIPPAA